MEKTRNSVNMSTFLDQLRLIIVLFKKNKGFINNTHVHYMKLTTELKIKTFIKFLSFIINMDMQSLKKNGKTLINKEVRGNMKVSNNLLFY